MGSSTGTRNFGLRRMTNLVREGRFRAPASGTELVLGSCVEIDASDTTRIRNADLVAVAGGGTSSGDVRTDMCGILWYEHDSQTYNDPRFGGAAGQLPQDLDTAPNGRMVQVLSGPGVKVWFRNTAEATTEPGLNFANTRSARTMVTGLGTATPTIVVGDLLGWNNTTKQWVETTTLDEAILRVTFVDNDLDICDAVFLV